MVSFLTCGNCGEKVHPAALDEHAAYQCVRIAMAKASGELTRPTADLGDDGELVERLRTPLSGSRTALVMEDGTWRDPLRLEAADRLILYREALAEARDASLAAFDLIAASKAAGKGPTNAEALLRLALPKIDAVLSRSGG